MALGKGLNSLIPQQKTRKIIRHETGIVNGEGRFGYSNTKLS